MRSVERSVGQQPMDLPRFRRTKESLHGLRGTSRRRRPHLMRLTRSSARLELQPLRARQSMRPVILGETSCEW